MKNILSRIVALFLVSCLAADASQAAALNSQRLLIRHVELQHQIFDQEALAVELMSVPRRMRTLDAAGRVSQLLSGSLAPFRMPRARNWRYGAHSSFTISVDRKGTISHNMREDDSVYQAAEAILTAMDDARRIFDIAPQNFYKRLRTQWGYPPYKPFEITIDVGHYFFAERTALDILFAWFDVGPRRLFGEFHIRMLNQPTLLAEVSTKFAVNILRLNKNDLRGGLEPWDRWQLLKASEMATIPYWIVMRVQKMGSYVKWRAGLNELGADFARFGSILDGLLIPFMKTDIGKKSWTQPTPLKLPGFLPLLEQATLTYLNELRDSQVGIESGAYLPMHFPLFSGQPIDKYRFAAAA